MGRFGRLRPKGLRVGVSRYWRRYVQVTPLCRWQLNSDRHATKRIGARKHDAKALMDFLRKTTYDLSPEPMASTAYGSEFEDKYRA